MWDERYSEPGYLYGTSPNDFLQAEFSRIPQHGKVLCLAEGEGRNAVFLATRGYSVTAVDQSRVGLEKARRLALEQGVDIEIEVADLAHYDLGRSCWDGIVSIWAHLPTPLREQLHPKVVDALKSGGVLILEAYTPRQLDMSGFGGPPPSQRNCFMTLDALRSELAGLDLLVARELEREISEGKGHQGLSAVVQVIASK